MQWIQLENETKKMVKIRVEELNLKVGTIYKWFDKFQYEVEI